MKYLDDMIVKNKLIIVRKNKMANIVLFYSNIFNSVLAPVFINFRSSTGEIILPQTVLSNSYFPVKDIVLRDKDLWYILFYKCILGEDVYL